MAARLPEAACVAPSIQPGGERGCHMPGEISGQHKKSALLCFSGSSLFHYSLFIFHVDGGFLVILWVYLFLRPLLVFFLFVHFFVVL